MRHINLNGFGAAMFAAIALATAGAPSAASAQDGRWVASWASSPSLPTAKLPFDFWQPAPQVQGTLRYRIRLSAGGDSLQVRLSGETQQGDTMIGSATVAFADEDGRIDPSSLRPLTFAGARSARIPAGAPVLSDAVRMPVKPGSILVLSFFLPATTTLPQADPNHVADWSQGTDQTASLQLGGTSVVMGRELMSQVLVHADTKARTIVAFGDSITDGFAAKNPLLRGWPGQLAGMIGAAGVTDIGIANAGIGGNRVLRDEVGPSALARFDRDALTVPGVTDIVLLEGVNDLGLSGLQNPRAAGFFPTVSAENLIAAYRQLIDRAHTRGVRIHGATITPFLGSTFPGYATEAKEKIRLAINQWVRASGAFDSVVDFDAAVRDPAKPDRLLPAYNSGDNLHPSDAGYAAMARAAGKVLHLPVR